MVRRFLLILCALLVLAAGAMFLLRAPAPVPTETDAMHQAASGWCCIASASCQGGYGVESCRSAGGEAFAWNLETCKSACLSPQ